MASGSVVLRGRFKPGTEVRLVRVPDERALRAEGGEEVGTEKVDRDGCVAFNSGVQVGGRYFVVGQVDGTHLEVRARGREKGDESAVLEQPPIGPDRTRLSDGSWVDEPPEQHQAAPKFEVGPALGQHQVPKGTVQRSDTPRGTAHPVDVKEPAPYRGQEDVPEGTVQMSDTETGRAAELVVGPQRQEDVSKGTVQRSDTPTGVATPIPEDAVEAMRERESSRAKETRGEPVRAAAEPLEDAKRVRGASEKRSDRRDEELAESEREARRTVPGAPSDRDDTSGRDAMGQPAAPDIAAASGLEPAKSPAEPVNTPKRKSAGKRRTASGSSSKSSKSSGSAGGGKSGGDSRSTKAKEK